MGFFVLAFVCGWIALIAFAVIAWAVTAMLGPEAAGALGGASVMALVLGLPIALVITLAD